MTGVVQQFAADIAMFILASIFEKMPHTIGLRSGLAVAYLVILGSTVAKLSVAVVLVYYFVNPIVAVWLGSLSFCEPFGGRKAIAMLIIFAGIALVQWSESLSIRPMERAYG